MIHRRRSWQFLLLTTPVLLIACGSPLDGSESPAASVETREPSIPVATSEKPFGMESLKPLQQGVSAMSVQNLGSTLGAPVASSNTCGATNQRNPSCAFSSAPDHLYRWTAPYTDTFTFTTSGSGYDTILHIYDEGTGAALGCNDDSGGTLQSSISLPLNVGQSIILVVDGYGSACGDYRLNISGASGGFHIIRARHSWLCLDIEGGSYSPGARVMQDSCHGGDNQQFLKENLGNGYYRLIAKHTRQCLDVEGASYSTGARLRQHPCHGGGNQQFLIENLGNGYHSIRAKHSWQVLDVEGGSYSWAQLIQHPWHGGNNQQFYFQ
jgi:hypothetical protein